MTGLSWLTICATCSGLPIPALQSIDRRRLNILGFAALRNRHRSTTAMNKTEQMEKYYGKFRGLVRNNIDPMGRGRIQADVPSISGMVPSWCMPCVPYAQDIRESAIPPVGTTVWIEFERGELDYPIWSGCFW